MPGGRTRAARSTTATPSPWRHTATRTATPRPTDGTATPRVRRPTPGVTPPARHARPPPVASTHTGPRRGDTVGRGRRPRRYGKHDDSTAWDCGTSRAYHRPVGALVDDAAAGVVLAIEPMHPMYAADRGVISTVGQALDVAEQFPAATVGVVVDTFHVWWDPQLAAQVRRAARGSRATRCADWITPLPPDALLARGMMGEGTSTSRPSPGWSPTPGTRATSRWRSSTRRSGTPIRSTWRTAR